MSEQFSRALARLVTTVTGTMLVLLAGTGILLLWNPALIMSIFVYGTAGVCLLFVASSLISLLAAAFKG